MDYVIMITQEGSYYYRPEEFNSPEVLELLSLA